MERRSFVKYLGTVTLAAAILPDLVACSPQKKKSVRLLGTDFQRGHSVRKPINGKIKITKKVTVKNLIVGGGISGLSSLYHLHKKGENNSLLLELNPTVGGNSSAEKTSHSWAPLGAHYLSLPNDDNLPLIAFLEENQLITGKKDGKYVYNERHLCHAPNERLLYRGQFQEGLVPEYGISNDIKNEIEHFFAWMRKLKKEVASDGRDAYSIPITNANSTEHLTRLDTITFDQFLKENNIFHEELLWFLDYCCRDDFGAGFDKVSAWAGIHYFAARKANPYNAEPTSVLTWPEGNYHLAQLLAKDVKDKIQANEVVQAIIETETGVIVQSFNPIKDEWTEYEAENCIVACPSYVCKHILHSAQWPSSFFEGFSHYPWFIGVVTVKSIPNTIGGVTLAWDNVKYGTKELGYVSNRHQELSRQEGPHVLSVYLTLDDLDPNYGRRKLFEMSEAEMYDRIVNELKGIHPEIENEILSIDVQRWGHGMVTPVPGTLKKHHEYLALAAQAKRVQLAHTDYAAYSIFEEGFNAGFLAAKRIHSTI